MAEEHEERKRVFVDLSMFTARSFPEKNCLIFSWRQIRRVNILPSWIKCFLSLHRNLSLPSFNVSVCSHVMADSDKVSGVDGPPRTGTRTWMQTLKWRRASSLKHLNEESSLLNFLLRARLTLLKWVFSLIFDINLLFWRLYLFNKHSKKTEATEGAAEWFLSGSQTPETILVTLREKFDDTEMGVWDLTQRPWWMVCLFWVWPLTPSNWRLAFQGLWHRQFVQWVFVKLS